MAEPNSSLDVLQIRATAENILPLHSHCVQQEQNKLVLRENLHNDLTNVTANKHLVVVL